MRYNEKKTERGLPVTRTSNVKTAVLCALGCAFLCICAMIFVPFAVPFTMQTFALALLLLLLGGKRTLLCVLLYLAVGAIGVPVFAGFMGGIGIFASFSGGFLVGFVAMAGIFACVEKQGRRAKIALACSFLGLYAVACIWCALLCVIWGTPMKATAVFSLCVLPYLLPDLLKVCLAFVLAKQLKKSGFFRTL